MTTEGSSTELGLTRGDRTFLLVVSPVVGLVLGLLLPRIADWASEHRWPLFGGVVRFVASWDGEWATVTWCAAGVALGLAFAVYAIAESTTMRLTDRDLQLRRNWTTSMMSRESVHAVFVDGKQLVLLGQGSDEVARELHDSKKALLGEAFRDHGWPWSDEDPHAGNFQRWVPELPGIPPAINALLAARGRALDKNDTAEADDLRREVARLGYVVRDEDKRQYVRVAAPRA